MPYAESVTRWLTWLACRGVSETPNQKEKPKMSIVPYTEYHPTCRQGRLTSKLTAVEITAKLGFEPNLNSPDKPSSDGKVTTEWQWKDNDKVYAIWDYKGSRWSYYGNLPYMASIFGSENVVDEVQ